MTNETTKRAGAFTRFRRTRPFWGGLLLIVAGYLIASPVMTTKMSFYTSVGIRGILPVLIGGAMIAAALVAIFAPSQRLFPAIVAAMLSVAALPMANLGGWIIGTVLGIVASGLVFAWTPFSDDQLAEFAGRERRKAERRAQRQNRAAQASQQA